MASAPPSLRGVLEALLLVADHPLGLPELDRLLTEFSRADIAATLRGIQQDLDSREGGYELREVAGGFRLQTRASLSPWVLRLKQSSPVRLSKPALETLAIVAYRQPVTRAEVEEIRGVDSSGTLRYLLDRKLLRIAGKKDVPGRPILYGTTRFFLELFDLKDLAALPSLEDLKDLEEAKGEGPALPLFAALKAPGRPATED